MLLGIPLELWGLICLAIAIVYFISWPKPREVASSPRWAMIVLRYFHSLVWLLLAATCFLWGTAGPALAQPFALLAGVFYAVFIVAYLKYGSRRR